MLASDKKPFGHCWIEKGGSILDFSNGKKIEDYLNKNLDQRKRVISSKDDYFNIVVIAIFVTTKQFLITFQYNN